MVVFFFGVAIIVVVFFVVVLFVVVCLWWLAFWYVGGCVFCGGVFVWRFFAEICDGLFVVVLFVVRWFAHVTFIHLIVKRSAELVSLRVGDFLR